MKRSRSMLLVLFMICLLLFGGVVAAQESTPEPDAPPVEVTTTSEGSIVLTIWQLLGGVVAAIAIGGIGGVLGVGTLAARLRSDATTIAAIEALAKSVPPETAQQVINLTGHFNKSVNELTMLVTEALDNIPAATK